MTHKSGLYLPDMSMSFLLVYDTQVWPLDKSIKLSPAEYTLWVLVGIASMRQSGPGCSKLTTSLVNDSLKFTSSDTQIR